MTQKIAQEMAMVSKDFVNFYTLNNLIHDCLTDRCTKTSNFYGF